MKKSKLIALCGMLASLSLVLMFLGSVISIFIYVAPLLCSLIMMVVCDAAGKKYAFITYLAVSIISVLLLPDKECALTYAFFFGYYIIIKDFLEKIKPKWLSFVSKWAVYNLGMLASQLLLIYAFGIPLDMPWGKWGIIVLIVLFNVVFFTYEFMLGRILMIYDLKYRNKVHKLLK